MPTPGAALRRYLPGLAVLLLFLLLGDGAARLARLPIPGNVIGMVLLAAALRAGVVPLALVRPAAELLLRYMAFFFVPPGVALMLYGDLLRAQWPAIVAGSLASTLAVLLLVGWMQQRLERRHG